MYVCTVKPYDFFFVQIKNSSVKSVYCSLFPDFFQADFTVLLDSQVRRLVSINNLMHNLFIL